MKCVNSNNITEVNNKDRSNIRDISFYEFRLKLIITNSSVFRPVGIFMSLTKIGCFLLPD